MSLVLEEVTMTTLAAAIKPKIEILDLGLALYAGFTLKDKTHENGFSTRLTDSHAPVTFAEISGLTGIPLSHTVLTAKWPHGDRVAIIKDLADTCIDQRFGTRNPSLSADKYGFENSCDGLVTNSHEFTLGVQSADCPMLFLHDPVSGVIGAIHCGWKPLVRGIIYSAVRAFKNLGSNPLNILAYLSPGAGDGVYEFGVNDSTRNIFADANREGLLEPQHKFIRPIEQAAKRALANCLGRLESEINNPAFALTFLATEDLRLAGIDVNNITVDQRSSILDPTLHSHRRDGDASGRSFGFIRFADQD